MRFFTSLTVFFASFGFMATSFADCPPPESITITENNGVYSVAAPNGFVYAAYNTQYPINATGPIWFSKVQLSNLDGNTSYQNVNVTTTICEYGIGENGSFADGDFSLYYTGSYQTNLDPASWTYADMSPSVIYLCQAAAHACIFSSP